MSPNDAMQWTLVSGAVVVVLLLTFKALMAVANTIRDFKRSEELLKANLEYNKFLRMTAQNHLDEYLKAGGSMPTREGQDK